ncbi:hypothetical protein CC1G_14736 [Coprinopsis cinerea okayama7|uniref:COPA/B TPR domain-containing protein n=1 Tax=Coprinopsis cinerea (strain Okayama-7 / 130 / ATCC MYA-4618 / FGSC 9003) TaxID=240176 RepID=D6RMM7_COPC7|nr:hypothetical protein CC1G_14736 [Coprinopsis cinerea okayama7\|eukprot:XP_002911307.1 hypothetical protein CC1G_14736 [Coprinopsis cinerea okayama7\
MLGSGDVLFDGPGCRVRAKRDRALSVWRFDLARESFEQAGDLGSLLLLLLSQGDRKGLQGLVKLAEEKGQNNLAFATLLQLGDTKGCVDLLIKTQRVPEAALFARTYAPSLVPSAVKAWKADLTAKGRPKIAEGIADPDEHKELFEEGWEEALRHEKEGVDEDEDDDEDDEDEDDDDDDDDEESDEE